MGTPFGKPAKVFHSNGPEYKAMAEQAIARLRERLTEVEFRAWQYRSFDRWGMPMDQWEWRMVWLAATMELSYPTECECGGRPDQEIVCKLCQSISHVSILAENEVNV